MCQGSPPTCAAHEARPLGAAVRRTCHAAVTRRTPGGDRSQGRAVLAREGEGARRCAAAGSPSCSGAEAAGGGRGGRGGRGGALQGRGCPSWPLSPQGFLGWAVWALLLWSQGRWAERHTQAPTQTRRPPAPGAGQQTAVHLQLWPRPQSAPALVCTRPGLWRRSGLPGTRGSALGQDARALRRGTSSAPWRPRIMVEPGCARPRPLAAPRQTCTLFVTPLLPHSRVGAQVLRAQAGQAHGLRVAPLPAGRGLS